MRRKNSCYLRSLSRSLSSLSRSLSAAAKLAFWQWNANVAGKVELPSSVSQFLSLSSQLLVLLLFPFPTPPCCGLCRRLVIDLNFMCTQQQQQQKKWISTALFVRPDSTSPPSPLPNFFCLHFILLLHFWQVPAAPSLLRLLDLANFEMRLP